MRGIYAVAGAAVLGAALIGWVALAWAQPALSKLPAADGPPPEGSAPSGSASPSVAPSPSMPAPAAGGPSVAPPGSGPAALPPGAYRGLRPSGGEPAPASPGQPAPAAAGDPAPLGAGSAVSAPGSHGDDAQPTVTNDNTTGRQEPAVSLEWIGPPVAKMGQPADYTVVVRNACNIPVQQVMVRIRVPQGMQVGLTEPKAVSEGNVLMWELGTLMPRQEKNLQMRLVAETKGDVSPQAWVTFTGSSVMRIKVREPKLALKAQATERALVGDPVTVVVTVTNPGDGPAEQVKIHVNLPEGLEHTGGKRTVDFEVGNLAPGESRNATLICATRSGGEQKCDAVAEAEGGLSARDQASVQVIQPRLDLQVIGPGLRYLDRKAVYTFKVTNPGDAPATNVTVSDVVPAGFKFLSASDGGRHDFPTRTVSWFLGEVPPGQSREVRMEVQAINVGEHRHHATAQGARGLKTEQELLTRVEGLSALLLEVVDTEDPIETGADTSYEIRVTNTGSKTETDIKLVAVIPDKMEFKSAQGPTRYQQEGRTIVFEPLPKLAPRADAIYRVMVKALTPGDVRFKIQVTSTNLVEPVIEMEATRIYSDAPEGRQ